MENNAHTPRQLGQILRGRRKILNVSQKDAAASVGLLPKTISKLELYPETATIESLFKLLSALNLELVVRPRPDEPSSHEW